MSEERHVSALTQQRESVALRRWLSVHAADFLRQLGLMGGWWCGVELDRARIGGCADEGDFDLLAGQLELDLTVEEWEKRTSDCIREWPEGTHQSWIFQAVVGQACREGRLIWPPRLDHMVGCEVKVSVFESERDPPWRRTHLSQGRKVIGQLNRMIHLGLTNVSFLHVAVTKPRAASNSPWWDASEDATRAMESFPTVFSPTNLPGIGYYVAAVGAVGHALEDWAGAGGAAICVQEPMNRAAAPIESVWKTNLVRHLSRLPAPVTPVCYVLSCTDCRAWFISHNPCDARCSQCTGSSPQGR